MGGGDNELIIKTILDTTGFTKGSKQLLRAINGLTNSLKGVFTRIVGVASVFGILSKAISTYMSQNQELTKQMNAAWTALGNALGPIITQIVNLVAKAVSYLVTLMKLLGFTAKTASQASKAAQGAGGALQRTVAGFDELNKLSSGGGGGAGTLQDFDPDVFTEKLAQLLKDKMWEDAGRLIAQKINEVIEKIDFAAIATKISEAFEGALEFLIGFIDGLDFKQVGNAIKTFFENIDWSGIAADIARLLETTWNAALEMLWGLLAGDSEEEPPLVKSLRSLGESIGKFAETVEPVIETVWKDYLEPFAKWLSETALPKLIQGISDRISDLADLLNGDMSFGDFISNMSLAEGAVGVFGTALGLVKLGDFITSVKTLSSKSVLGKLCEVFALTSSGAGTLGESIVTVFPGVGKALSSLKTGIGGVGSAFSKLFGFLAKNPFVIIIAGIVGLISYLVHLYKTNEEFREKVDAAWAAVKEAIGKVVDWIKEKWESFKESIESLKEKFTAFKDHLAEKWEAIKSALDPATIKDNIVTAFGEIKDSVSEKWEALKEKTSTAWGEIKGSISTNISNVKTAISEKWDAIAGKTKSVWENVKENVSGKFAEVRDNVMGRASEIWGSIRDTWTDSNLTVWEKVTSIAGTIRSTFSDIVSNVGASMTNIIDKIIPGFSDLVSGVSQKMGEIWDTVRDTFTAVVRNAVSWGADLIHNFWEGIKSQFSGFFDGIRGFAQGIRDFLGFSEPKKGPLSDFHTYGPDMMDLYARGIAGESGKVFSAVNDVAEGVSNVLNGNYALSSVGSGAVVPYGVSGGESGSAGDSSVSGDELRNILVEIRDSLATMEFVAQFGDLRALAQRVTTIQKQIERANG